MRKERSLYILLVILFITYVVVEYYSPKPIDWTITYSQKDKNPFGSYILYERLDDIFPRKSISFQTLPEVINSEEHIFILSTNMYPAQVDIDAIFKILNQGRSIFISAQNFSANFLDTLGLEMDINTFEPLLTDSAVLHFHNKDIYFPTTIVNSYFELDTSETWNIHGEAMGPVLISKKFGQGKLILSSTPLAFTNYGMLCKDNHAFMAKAFQLLPFENILYSRFYHSGKPESQTPLRYFLSVAPLRWAVYLSLLVLILFLIVNSRRFQRFIPVLEPPKNSTVHFIKTIGGLYYREGNHKLAAQKMINHFQKSLLEKYHIYALDESTFPVLAAKTGVSLEDVIHTFSLIQTVRHTQQISEETLKNLYEKIKIFKIH